ncbi:MAG TPA: phosphatase PAP2 family protein [Terriglobales bacterium]|nr:phosphatase PAP2 family protein [Terriglobales bacterium]
MNRFASAAAAVVICVASWANPAAAQNSGCVATSVTQARYDLARFGTGLRHTPRNMVRRRNLEWEIPVALGAAALIGAADRHASNQVTSASLQSNSSLASNIGLGLELGASGAAWLAGCHKQDDGLRSTGEMALEAAGVAQLLDLGLKEAFRRVRPNGKNEPGDFWDGGSSFPSGHATVSFAIASVVAHRAHRRWIKWGAYGLATAVTAARFGARKHFLSDLVIGSTLGYVTGTYLSEPH